MSTPIPDHPKHGDYHPAHGWFSKVRGGWIRNPNEIGTVVEAPPITQQARDDFARMNGPKPFKPDPNMEALIRLRSSQLPEERQTFNDLVSGTRRMELHAYESAKASAEPNTGA